MKILWLEQMVKEGSVSPAARDAILTDCMLLLKTASPSAEARAAADAEKFGKYLDQHKAIIGTAAVGVAGLVGSFFTSKLRSARDMASFQKDITSVRKTLSSHEDFAAHPEKFNARFNDLVSLAPSIARNKDLTARILKEKLQGGFSAQDATQLTQVQATYTPDMKYQMNLSGSVKKASEQMTGELVADVIHLCKEAGISGKTLGRAVENALTMSAIPVLGGVGIGAVRHLMEKNDRKKMEAALTNSFETAYRRSPEDSELRVDKEKARQAFQILAHFSPHVALQPEAARSFMHKMVSYDNSGRGAVQVEDIKGLSEIQRNYSSGGRGSAFIDGLTSGARALGIDHALRSGVQGLGGALNHELDGLARLDLDLGSRKDGSH
jgi:hypothetical protein